MFNDKVVTHNLHELLQMVPASYISQVLLQLDEKFLFCKIRKRNYHIVRPAFSRYLAMFDLFSRAVMRVDTNVYSLLLVFVHVH